MCKKNSECEGGVLGLGNAVGEEAYERGEANHVAIKGL